MRDWGAQMWICKYLVRLTVYVLKTSERIWNHQAEQKWLDIQASWVGEGKLRELTEWSFTRTSDERYGTGLNEEKSSWTLKEAQNLWI